MRFLVVILLFLSCEILAQAPYESGYVILNNGDTVFGVIKDRKFTKEPAQCDKISFKISFTDSAESKIHYTPYDIKQYCKKGKLFFYTLPVGFDSKPKFCQMIVDGDVVLFGYVNNTQAFLANDMSAKVKDGLTSEEEHTFMEYFLQYKNKPRSLMKVHRKTFEETTTFFFQDNVDLVQKIQGKQYKYTDLETLVKLYNESKKQTK